MLIGRNIQVVQSIKPGGTANLYLGVDLYTGQPVAVKELKPGFFKNEMVREKFLEEANRYLYLEHPNIVKLKDFIDKGDTQYLVMEYIDGYDLSDYVSNISGPLPLYSIALIMNEVLSALDYAHDRNLIHLDLKPSNIFLSGKDMNVKLADFGTSQQLTKNYHFVHECMGTLFYISPEVCKGEPFNTKTDIWALGCILYEMCTNRKPFDGLSDDNLKTKIISY
jgi:serine/threonine protein kinase